MPNEKSKIKTEKNTLSSSQVSAKEKVHIGDIIYTVNNMVGDKKEEKKRKQKSIYIGMTFIFLMVVGIIGFNHADRKNKSENQSSSTLTEKIKEPNTEILDEVKPAEVEPEKKIPKKTIEYVNTLAVKTNSEKHNSLFASYAGRLLRVANIKFQINGKENVANQIECHFDLQKQPTIIGGTEAFEYSITLEVNIYGSNRENCSLRFYSSKKERIGYAEDSESTIRKKIIEPALAEIETEFKISPPVLCKKK